MIDLIAGEYGWTADEILAMPIDQPPQLIHAMLHRRGVKVFKRSFEKDKEAPSLADRMKSILHIDTSE